MSIGGCDLSEMGAVHCWKPGELVMQGREPFLKPGGAGVTQLLFVAPYFLTYAPFLLGNDAEHFLQSSASSSTSVRTRFHSLS